MSAFRLSQPLRALVAIVVATAAMSTPPAAAADARYTVDPGFSATQRALIDRAVGRFEKAGLALPDLSFELHDDAGRCRGAAGFYSRDEATIRICTPDTGLAAQELYLHEVAHAWDDHALSDRGRQAFLRLRGAETWWDDGSAPWHTFGAEQAAQIIMWGLIDRPIRLATIAGTTCGELRAGYVLLTGAPPLHGFTDLCATDR